MAQRFEITDMVFRNVGQALLAHQGASVTVKDLQGNNLTVFQGETGGSTFSNPLTSDSNGQIEGWVEAPDFDLAVTGAGISSYTQKVRQSPPGTFAAESYGAKVDGSTDDATAVQAALTAIQTAGRGKLTISKAGTCKVNSALTYAADDLEVELGPGTTLDFSAAAASTVLLSATGTEASSGTGFEALTANAVEGDTTLTVATASEFSAGDHVKVGSTATFDPGRTDQPLGEIAVVASGVGTTVTLKSPLVGGPYNTADSAFVAKLAQFKGLKIRGGKVKGGGAGSSHVGFRADRCRDIRVFDTTFEDVEDQALSFYDCVNVNVRGVTVVGSNLSARGYGVFFAWACQDCTVSDSFFRDCRHMVTTGGGTSRKGVPRRITYADNHGKDLSGDGIDSHAASEDVTVTGNTVYDVTGIGINCDGPKVTITGNNVRRTSSHGIYMHNESTAATDYRCTGNTVNLTGGDGIRFSNGATSGSGQTIRGINITGNTVASITGIGLRASNTSTGRFHSLVLSNNTVRSANSVTANVYVIKFDNAVVNGNTVTDIPATQIGIRLEDITKSSCVGNTTVHASLSTGFGVRVLSGTDITVGSNTVKDAGTGVAFDSATTFSICEGNNVRGCTTPTSLSTGAGNLAYNNVPGVVNTVTAAATVTVPASEGDILQVSGNTGITSITATSMAGRTVKLVFTGTPTVTDGSNLKLAGNFVAAGTTNDPDVLVLSCDGTNWYEDSRSVN